MISKPLPIGLDDFAKVIRDDYYYVDKSLFIKELLDKKGEVNLFTRPRRFGKTLNMSMLRYFLETNVCEAKKEDNRALFQGLLIMEAGDKYTEEMGKYPVISLSLKSAKQPDYYQAFYALNESISGEYKRHADMLAQMNLNPEDKQRYQRMMQMKAPKEECNSSLYFLSYCLYQAYGKKTVILIDEYNPWSVMNFMDALKENPAAIPSPYWANTSSNLRVSAGNHQFL